MTLTLLAFKSPTLHAANRIKFPSMPSDFAGQLVGIDTLLFPSKSGITPDTKFTGWIRLDNYSFNSIYGLRQLTTGQVVQSLKQFAADNGHVDKFGLLIFEKIESDSSSQFTRNCHFKATMSELLCKMNVEDNT